jgi:hypothetical protein
MEPRPTAGLESRFERKPPMLRLYEPTALRSRNLGNSKELQEVNRRLSHTEPATVVLSRHRLRILPLPVPGAQVTFKISSCAAQKP